MEHKRKQQRKKEERELRERKERIRRAREEHEKARKEDEERRQQFPGEAGAQRSCGRQEQGAVVSESAFLWPGAFC